MNSPIVTRFAPSPTGFLHIGGARTALFNWLYARGRSGKFLLRIEDTDRVRYTPEAVQAILDGLKWLGLDWDGDAISQFERIARHAEVAREMVALGKAYYCYTPQEEITAAREAATAKGEHFHFKSEWRDKAASAPHGDEKAVIRLKAPLTGETIIDDQVQGRVTFQNKELDDMVLLRSDGTPTYMLAVVVDDHDMGVTHIIRGVDHLTNAARQVQIYEAMGWEIPVMTHIPLIHGADGAKLSKRHGALGVEAYRDMGYLPEALCNYLARLGWSHGDDEIFTIQQMIEWFDIKDVNKSAARFDFEKLGAINAAHMKMMGDDEIFQAITETMRPTQATYSTASEAIRNITTHNEQLSEAIRKATTPNEQLSETIRKIRTQNEQLSEAIRKITIPSEHLSEAMRKITIPSEQLSEAMRKITIPSEQLSEAMRKIMRPIEEMRNTLSPMEELLSKAGQNSDIQKMELFINKISNSIKPFEELTKKMAFLDEIKSNSSFIKILPALKERTKTIPDFINQADFLYIDPLTLDEKAQAALTPETLPRLNIIQEHLEKIDDSNWTEETLQSALKAIVAETGIKFGDLAAPLRAALTGRTTSPSLSIVMHALGREKTLERIHSVIARSA